jgi:hypothetical protein
MIGDSILDYKKLLRAYVRMYISDIPHSIAGSEWRFSVNYNDFYFVSTNPSYVLQPTDPEAVGNKNSDLAPYDLGMPVSLIPIFKEDKDESREIEVRAGGQPSLTYLYKRTYQIPIPQHRVKEFTFQLSRAFTKLIGIFPRNENPDRPVQSGYYCMLSGFWVDYNEKSRL